MYRPWIVRSVALLLTLVGMQAGAFEDLDSHQKRYFGVCEHGWAVLAESRKAEPAIDADPAPAAPGAPAASRPLAATAAPARCVSFVAALLRLLPAPTGPPRA